MTTGSYWVYEYSQTDTAGNTTVTGTDTVKITGDSVINGNVYKVFEGSFLYNCSSCKLFRRDSSGYLISETGRVYFSASDFDTLHIDNSQPSLYAAYYKMLADTSVTVPAGTFNTLDYLGHVYVVNPNSVPNPRITGNFYAYNIGIVKTRSVFIGGTEYLEAKLLSYYIAP